MKLPMRQVHLDFHTSELIENIGYKFSKENFKENLIRGNVSSITVFAKCHHGMCYYPTKIGKMHPNLKFDLLKEQITAAHSVGVRAPVYITAGWSVYDTANESWLARNKDGSVQTVNYDVTASPDTPKPFASWQNLCLAGEYADYIYKITEEICLNYDIDGLFYDICFNEGVCYCESCISGMKNLGLDPDNEADARQYYKIKRLEFMKKCGELLKKYHPKATIFFNGSCEPELCDFHGLETHYELEDLPTAWGGYDKFPFRAKYFSRYEKPIIAMTGKFHTSWGEFGGYKTKDALKFECASMLAFGAGCSVGDQLHPNGLMDSSTYELIGDAYSYVKSIEDICRDSKLVTNLGLWISSDPEENEGMSKILLEKQLDFDYACADNLREFDTLIVPCNPVFKNDDVKLINDFIKTGKKTVLMGNCISSGIDCGIEFIGKSGFDIDYAVVGEKISDGMVRSPFLFYESAYIVKADGYETLASIREPYFNRTYGHYCSHMNTPYREEPADYPAVCRKDNLLYFAHDVGRIYRKYGSVYHRTYFCNALGQIYNGEYFNVSLGGRGRATLRKSADGGKYLLHLLYASPYKSGAAEIIDDTPKLYNIPVKLNISGIKKVTLLPDGKRLDFTDTDDGICFEIASLHIHQLIAFEK